MNKDSSEFMLEEYEQIASAFFGLRDQMNEWFKAYLVLVGLPLTLLAAAMKLGEPNQSVSLNNLPDVVAGLLLAIALLGFFATSTIVAMRMEMILYARTVNGIRRYFVEMESATGQQTSPSLIDYLILPTTDMLPPFFEKWRSTFWQVLLIGVSDGLLLIVGVHSLLSSTWVVSVILGFLYALLHLLLYWAAASRREKEWVVQFPQVLGQPHH